MLLVAAQTGVELPGGPEAWGPTSIFGMICPEDRLGLQKFRKKTPSFCHNDTWSTRPKLVCTRAVATRATRVSIAVLGATAGLHVVEGSAPGMMRRMRWYDAGSQGLGFETDEECCVVNAVQA